MHAQFSGVTKQMIVNLEPTEDEERLIVGLVKEKKEMVKPKNEAKRKTRREKGS